MAVFLIYSPGDPFNNSTGRNAVIAAGESEAAARTAAQGSVPDGETRCPAAWPALQLAATEEHAALTAVGGVVWIQGPAAEPLRPARGA